MLGAYRDVLRLPGAAAFTAAGFVARLPIAIMNLGIVLYVAGLTGSYAQAGVTAAAYVLSAAAGAVITSRIIDRRGQHRVLPPLVLVHAAALAGFVIVVGRGAMPLWQVALAALAGLTQPAIGSAVRSRWAVAVRGPQQLRSAFALESVLDELIFTIGPIVTAVLAQQVALPVPIVLATALVVTGTLLLAVQKRTEPAPVRNRARHPLGALRVAGVPVLCLAAIGVGGVFGTYEVSVVAFTERAGHPELSGIVLALWAVGSLVGGLWFGSRRWASPPQRQLVLLAAALVVLLLPGPLVPSVPLLAVLSAVSGLAIAPVLISLFSSAERLVPPGLLTEGLTWVNSGLAIGFSLGSALSGATVDRFGTAAALMLPPAFAAMALAVLAVGAGAIGRGLAAAPAREPVPPIALNADPIPGPGPGA